ncbi:MAG: flagellar motor protein MotA [Alphaproteobacteria bacterium]|nr:MAG: flagellar motor protein MotA [Alphaproteobacteria bacterium]
MYKNGFFMSLTALAGALFGVFLFCVSIAMSTDNYASFFDWPSLLMVLGGSVATAYMSFQAIYVNIAFKAIIWMFRKPVATRDSLNAEIARLIKWSYVVQKSGIPALENEVKNVPPSDSIMSYCLTLVATNHAPDELRSMMETAIHAQFERHTIPAEVLRSMAGSAPAFGMLGTLIGLVVMLQSFGEDLGQIGSGLSLALITTLYGVLFARMLFLPAAMQLQQKEEIELFRNQMMIEGLIMLSQKKGPRFMQDKLNSFLDPVKHFDIDRQLRG